MTRGPGLLERLDVPRRLARRRQDRDRRVLEFLRLMLAGQP